eukprot:8461291-Pyramimonas_sp.AAC.1
MPLSCNRHLTRHKNKPRTAFKGGGANDSTRIHLSSGDLNLARRAASSLNLSRTTRVMATSTSMDSLSNRLQGIKGVLLDKDGTLVDYYKTWTTLNNMAAIEVAQGDEDLAQILLKAGGWCHRERKFIPGSALVAGNCNDLAKLWHPLLPPSMQAECTVQSIEEAVDDVFYEGCVVKEPCCTIRHAFTELLDTRVRPSQLRVRTEGLRFSSRPRDKRFGEWGVQNAGAL